MLVRGELTDVFSNKSSPGNQFGRPFAGTRVRQRPTALNGLRDSRLSNPG